MRNYLFIIMIFSNFLSQFIYAAEFFHMSQENSYDEYGGSGNVLENYLYGKGGHFKLRDLGLNELQSYAEESSKGNKLIHLACLIGNIDIVKKSISQLDINTRNDDGDTPLHCACRKNHLHIVRFLVLTSVDKDIQNKSGQKAYSLDICLSCLKSGTPLHDASMKGHDRCLKNILEWSSKGINDASYIFNCLTPLHLAVKYLQAPCVKILLDFGARVRSKYPGDSNPFHEAFCDSSGYKTAHLGFGNKNQALKQIAILLIKATESVPLAEARNAKDFMGGTPLTIARRYNLSEIATMLESYGGVDPFWNEFTTTLALTGAPLGIMAIALPQIVLPIIGFVGYFGLCGILAESGDDKKNHCDGCKSQYYKNKSYAWNNCPECAHVLWGYPNCEHTFINERCSKCYWDGSISKYHEQQKEAQKRDWVK